MLGCSGNPAGNEHLSDMLLLRTDTSGTVLWEQSFGTPNGFDIFASMKRVGGDKFIMVGFTQSENYMYDLMVTDVNALGMERWIRTLGGDEYFEYASDLAIMPDSGYICLGMINQVPPPDPGFNNIYLAGLTKGGNVKWEKILEGTEPSIGSCIIPLDSGQALIAGSTLSPAGPVGCALKGLNDALLIRTDSSGNILWQQCYGGSGTESFAKVIVSNSGDGFLAAGYSSSNDGDVSGNHGANDFWIVKLDAAGVIEWQKCYGGSGWEGVFALAGATAGGYYVGGYTSSNDGQVSGNHSTSMNYRDMWIIHISDDGDLLWQQCIGGSLDEILYDIAVLPSGRLALFGETFTVDSTGDVKCNNGGFQRNWLVLAVDTNYVGVENHVPATSFSVAPNPSTGKIWFRRAGAAEKTNVAVTITDLAGKVMAVKVFDAHQTQMELDMGGFGPGIYLYRAVLGKRMETGKLVLME
jgi:hypothetical protein